MILEALRDALKQDTRPMAIIAKELGINEITLFKFKAGKTALRVPNLEQLADILGYEFQLKQVRVLPPHVHDNPYWKTRVANQQAAVAQKRRLDPSKPKARTKKA